LALVIARRQRTVVNQLACQKVAMLSKQHSTVSVIKVCKTHALDTKQVILEMLFPVNLFVQYTYDLEKDKALCL